ncbi:MAG: hypothetical protein EXS02_09185, partial [Planctomycetes bacterium]|nr:hypothetical protein [Planctomycetota bacterium]
MRIARKPSHALTRTCLPALANAPPYPKPRQFAGPHCCAVKNAPHRDSTGIYAKAFFCPLSRGLCVCYPLHRSGIATRRESLRCTAGLTAGLTARNICHLPRHSPRHSTRHFPRLPKNAAQDHSMKQSRHRVPTVFAALGQTSLAAARSLALPAARTAALPLLLPLALLIALPAALPSVLHAQQTGFTWTQVASTGPQSRYSHAMVYDSGRNRTVLFGGIVGIGLIGDTWEWNGATAAWTQVASTGPQSRYDHAMAYDSGRNRTVLFGGTIIGGNGSGPIGDTWEWNGATAAWTLVASTGPQSRSNHAMAYDSGRNRTVLFGGVGTFSNLGDTWEWNGATAAWTQVASTGPQSRYAHVMAYDSGRNRTVLFGGAGSSILGDTWEWNGVTAAWTQVASTGPQSRFYHAMAYDSGRNRTVVFGGLNGVGIALGDTWEWNGATAAWTQVASNGPQSRWDHAMAYDSGRNRTVLFGGYAFGIGPIGDTWEGGVNASASAYGTGCGSPALTISPGALPRINTTAQALLTNIPASLAFVCLGWSNTTTGIFALPLSL